MHVRMVCRRADGVRLDAGRAGGATAATGTLRITVHDPSGAVVPAALVQVRGIDVPTESVARDVSSDGVGVAVAQELAPGKYSVTVSFPGFETRSVPDDSRARRRQSPRCDAGHPEARSGSVGRT
jgi:hypothetical protein